SPARYIDPGRKHTSASTRPVSRSGPGGTSARVLAVLIRVVRDKDAVGRGASWQLGLHPVHMPDSSEKYSGPEARAARRYDRTVNDRPYGWILTTDRFQLIADR